MLGIKCFTFICYTKSQSKIEICSFHTILMYISRSEFFKLVVANSYSIKIIEIRCLKSYTFLQIAGLCKLLNQNSESLTSLEFIHCTLSSASITAIFCSLPTKSLETDGIKNFSINTTNFLATNPSSVPLELVSFLSSRRYVCSNIRPHLNKSKFWSVFFTG